MKTYFIAMLLLLGAIPLSAQNPQPKDNEKEEEAEAPKNTEDEENQNGGGSPTFPAESML